jgi:hypothetical protein
MDDIYLCAFSRIPSLLAGSANKPTRAKTRTILISALLSGARRERVLESRDLQMRVSGKGFRTRSLGRRVVLVVEHTDYQEAFFRSGPSRRSTRSVRWESGYSSIPRGSPNGYFANQPLLGMTLSARLKLASRIDD